MYNKNKFLYNLTILKRMPGVYSKKQVYPQLNDSGESYSIIRLGGGR